MIREIMDGNGDVYFVPTCDGGGCLAELEGMFDTHVKAVNAMGATGWVTAEDGEEIQDYCPGCKRRME